MSNFFNEANLETFKTSKPGTKIPFKLSVRKSILEHGLNYTSTDIFNFLSAVPTIKSVEIHIEESQYDNEYVDILTWYKL